jgi:energy-coupling factor transport system ATP-binding protein
MEEAIRADRVIVIDEGKVLLDGTPREVFSSVDTLKKVGLDVPQVTELMLALDLDGIHIAMDALTVSESADAIEAYMKKHSLEK